MDLTITPRRFVSAVATFIFGIALHVFFRWIGSWYLCGACDVVISALAVYMLFFSGEHEIMHGYQRTEGGE